MKWPVVWLTEYPFSASAFARWMEYSFSPSTQKSRMSFLPRDGPHMGGKIVVCEEVLEGIPAFFPLLNQNLVEERVFFTFQFTSEEHLAHKVRIEAARRDNFEDFEAVA